MRFSLQTTILAALAFACGNTQMSAAADGPLADFTKRVEDYARLQKELARQVPAAPKKAEPEQIERHKEALANAIIKARAGAQPGDFFTPEVKPILMRIIRQDLAGSAGKPARDAIKESTQESPVAPSALKVNAIYPEKAALSTVPPDLLLKLPKLPAEVEYRFAGRNLILRSAMSGVILDFIPGAMPATAKLR